MVRIRLRRVGRKKQASFRMVAADKESPRDGRFLEIVGFYNPRTHPATIQLKEDRIYDWMSKGAQPSNGAEQVLRSAGYFERYERFKAGEEVATLLEEAAAGEATRNINVKTRRDAPTEKAAAKVEEKAPVVEEAAAEEAVTEEAEVEEAVEEPVVEAEETVAAEAPAETEEKEDTTEAEEAETPAEEAEEEAAEEKAPEEEAEAPEEETPAEDTKAEGSSDEESDEAVEDSPEDAD